MIERILAARLRHMAGKFPVVTVTGPRQSGKTTLCRSEFPDKPYVSLEPPDTREFALRDPRGFLSAYEDGAILDEVHRAPELLSYLQPMVDARPSRGRFILTGSAQFSLLHSLNQSLAGRTALLELPPMGLEEVRRFPNPPTQLYDLIWRGGYPAVYDRELEPGEWYPSYVTTYLERDVRAILNVGDIMAFQAFLRLAAGRVGQLVNLSSLGADAGITHSTTQAWLAVLEAGYLAWRLRPWHANVSKRLIKTPKLHFLDTGLVCYLLGIRSAEQLRDHPLRGAIFETWVASEIHKSRAHRGLPPALSFYRDSRGEEVDLLLELGRELLAIEVKSGATVAQDFFTSLDGLAATLAKSPRPPALRKFIVYGGAEAQSRAAGTVIPWSQLDQAVWWSDAELGADTPVSSRKPKSKGKA